MTDFFTGALVTEAEANGIATSADWSHWIGKGKAPPSLTGHEFQSNVVADLELLKSLGVTELAVTLEWARVQPTPSSYDQLQVELFRHLLSEISDAGIEPWVCLVDGTLPGWFSEDEGGFSLTRSRTLVWPRHVEWAGDTFHNHVAGWIAQREPVRRAIRSNLLGVAPPGKRSAVEAGKAVAHTLLAEVDAWRVLQGSKPVALFHTIQSFHPELDNVRAAPEAAWLQTLHHDVIHHALVDGVIDIPDGPRHEVDDFREAFDRLIVQVRPPIQIDGDGRWSLLRAPLVEAHAEAIGDAVHSAGDRQCVIAGDLSVLATTEFGQREDDRAEGLHQLIGLAQSQSASGWWQTSPIDGWHWEHGFGVQPGLATRDRELRPAAEAFTERGRS